MLLALLAGLAVTAFIGSRLDRSLMPERSSGDFRIDLELPAGTPLEETVAASAGFAAWLEADPDVHKVFTQAGRTERTLAAVKDYSGPNTAEVRVILEAGRGGRRKGLRIQREAVERLNAMPGVQYVFQEEGIGLRELLASDEAPFSLGVVADDPMTALEYAEELMHALNDRGVVDDPHTDRVLGTPNLVMRLDAEEIARNGLDPDRLAREIRNRVRGVEATTFNEVDQRIDISVRIPRDERRDLTSALNSPVQLASGETIPLRSFIALNEERPVRELTRRNQQRMVTISAELRRGSLDDAWRETRAIAATLDLPPNVRLVSGGEHNEMVRSFKDLGWAMALAILLVYMILAAQFESFVDPLLIASVIPIGLAGSILAVTFSGGSLNLLSIIGMVALLGIAVNDAIIKIDTMRRLRSDGMDGYEAILEASRLRLRPILMTSATTILAMVPMAIGIGSGEQLQRPLALTIIGGLFLTTALTLFYTPILYKITHRIKEVRA
jgi:HAE1 family hydrophobic/amphiphilic exporter-1